MGIVFVPYVLVNLGLPGKRTCLLLLSESETGLIIREKEHEQRKVIRFHRRITAETA